MLRYFPNKFFASALSFGLVSCGLGAYSSRPLPKDVAGYNTATIVRKIRGAFFLVLIIPALAACGLYTPDKDPFTSDARIPPENVETRQGNYESGIVDHVMCEISQGVIEAQGLLKSPLFENKWGATVTLSITVEDQTGLSPGVSLINPLRNVLFPFPTGGTVTSPQSFSLSIGGTASVNALRTETIQWTATNKDLIAYPCNAKWSGVLIDGDLKVGEFIYDKAFVIKQGNSVSGVQFNTWTEEITFVSSYGGAATPTWKLARVSANASSNLVVAQRTNTNDLIITLGPLDPCQQSRRPPMGCPPGAETFPLQLISAAMNQHNARVQANAIAVSISGQTH